MSVFPFNDILSTFKDGISRALRVKSESSITGGYSPANLTMQNAVTANGNGTLLNVNEYATAVLEIRGTFSATINFESSIDDTNWYPVLATKNDGTISSSCTTVGLYEIKVAGEKSVRARVSGYVSGNVTVVGKVSPLVNAEKSMQLTGSIVVIASYLNQPIAIKYYGATVSADINLAIPADFTKHKVKQIYIVNNTNIAVTYTPIYACYALNAGAKRRLVGAFNPPVVASGASRLFTSRDTEIANINDPYPGLLISPGFAEVGTGTFDLYIIGGV